MNRLQEISNYADMDYSNAADTRYLVARIKMADQIFQQFLDQQWADDPHMSRQNINIAIHTYLGIHNR